ncbi:MAG: efflux RND transporter permease subunit [Proteobacteria bacterium]|nr:efflux RND transporter permease subunit [Pseudomonadota bacterium]
MKIAEVAIRNRVVTLVLTIVTIGVGASSFQSLSRLEDPEFTIKEALIITPYPGASPEEVEEEVTDKIELAIQQLPQLKRVKESRSERGISTVTAEIKDQYDKDGLPQVWDELRRKVGDVASQLPPGAGPSLVVDDFGDVWGVFIALTGPEYSYAELYETAKLLRRELTLVQDVAKVKLYGVRKEVIYIEPSRDRLSQLGISPEVIERELREKNVVADAGRVEVGVEFIAIEPTGAADTVESLGSTIISPRDSDRQIYLRDVASIRRGYLDPPDKLMRYDGKSAIGIGISTVSGGNVVEMGNALSERTQELLSQIPLGMEFGLVSVQSTAVEVAIDGFLVSLYQAIAIVIVVLLLFMGLRAALLIGFILLVTILGTFIFMGPWQVSLERISLGALIIALGMLVDNAIVVVDGMLIRMQQGRRPEDAANEIVGQQAMPLLGATAVAIMAFAAIGTSDDSTGEFCRSLFQVVFISLGLSWVTAVTVTPLLCVMFLKVPEQKEGAEPPDPYAGGFYAAYRGFLGFCLRRRPLALGTVVGLFAASVYGFGYVDQSFFPDSTRPQFLLDYWMPRGTHIQETARDTRKVEEYLLDLDEVTHVSTVIGEGAMRFVLTYAAEKNDSGYAQFMVDVDDYRKIDALLPEIEQHLAETAPYALVYTRKFMLGPGDGGKIQIRIIGPELDEIRRIASQVESIMHADGGAKAIRTNWRHREKVLTPIFAETQANLNGITRENVAKAIQIGFGGSQLGVYREGDELLPIIERAPEEERADVANIRNLQIWSPVAHGFIPLRQVVSGFETTFEDPIITRRDRKRTLWVHCDPRSGNASTLLARLMPKVGALELPPDYTIEYGGEYESSADAQAGLAATIPAFLLAMVLVVVMLFNALRQPLIIWLCVPLALIGVTAGLLATGQPFGFMALLGFMSLSGMLIKNGIVLIDQIDFEIRGGKDTYLAIVDSAVSRLRPVGMAALTTVLGMIPLLFDAFFVSLAVTVMAGLSFATLLTMIVVPVLYAVFFGATEPEPGALPVAR